MEGFDPEMENYMPFEIRTSLEGLLSRQGLKLPEIRLPVREGDCPAAPVCESIGNLQENCIKGGTFDVGTQKCMASLIILVSRVVQQWPEDMEERVEKNRAIGFLSRDE